MTSQETTLEEMQVRLSKLEKQNRRLKQVGAVALIVAASLLVMGKALPTKTVTFSKAERGRFQIVINPNMRADTFLLDTKRGKIWSRGKEVELKGEPHTRMYEARIDSHEELLRWLSTQHNKAIPNPPQGRVFDMDESGKITPRK